MMLNPFWSVVRLVLSAQAARMCWEAQAVMLLRSMRIAKGGPRAEAKTQRMIAEKVAALAQAQIAAMVATLKGGKKDRAAKEALAVYASRVRRNRRRLSK